LSRNVKVWSFVGMVLLAVLSISSLVFGEDATLGFGEDATADIFAEIATAISVVKVEDLDFGWVVAGFNAGTVVVGTNGDANSTLTIGGNTSAAEFEVSGRPNNSYAITLPSADVTLTGSNPVNTMVVNNFVSSKVGNQGTLDAVGSDLFSVGATLNVAANQAVDIYTGQFTVSVDYN
jgi:hypothetical protein